MAAGNNGSNEMTVIGRDTRIKGEMFFEGSARILGTFEGKINAEGEVQVGRGATCRATIEAERILVDGLIEGDIIASDVLTLNADARVEGDITAAKLVVVEGATFTGQCRVGPIANSTGSTASSDSRTRSSSSNISTSSAPSVSAPRATTLRPSAEPKPTIETRSLSLETDRLSSDVA